MSYIAPLKAIRKSESNMYGGKAASLGEMLNAGIPVPNGFGIAAQACAEFSEAGPSEEFVTELYAAFDRLGAARVAVRSSAIAEDSSDASWAGQLESYLNVERDGLLESVKKCWDSIHADWVQEYAKDKNVKDADLLVGIAVQQMVDSEVSGVLFTVDPVSQDEQLLVIEAVYGLGEMIVQGIVTPDHWVVQRDSLAVRDFEINIKKEQMIYRGGETVIVSLDDQVGDKATLREAQVQEIARLGYAIEAHYGHPQDIEWAFSNGKFYIVQARPITTLRHVE